MQYPDESANKQIWIGQGTVFVYSKISHRSTRTAVKTIFLSETSLYGLALVHFLPRNDMQSVRYNILQCCLEGHNTVTVEFSALSAVFPETACVTNCTNSHIPKLEKFAGSYRSYHDTDVANSDQSNTILTVAAKDADVANMADVGAHFHKIKGHTKLYLYHKYHKH